MKRTFLWVAIVLISSATLFSCSSDESTSEPQQTNNGNNGNNDGNNQEEETNLLLGTWDLVERHGEVEIVVDYGNGQTISYFLESTSINSNAQVTFSENPNMATTTGTYTADFEWTEEDGNVFDEGVAENLNLENVVGAYEMTGENTFTMTSAIGIVMDITIQSLTDEYLYYTTTYEYKFENNGWPATEYGSGTFEYTR